MAGIFFEAQTGVVALAAGVAKTVLQIVAATNTRILIHEFSVSFDGVTDTAVPAIVSAARQTTAGTASALTLAKNNESDGETLQSTGQHSATVEPTTGSAVISEHVHPQGGGYTWKANGKPIVVKGGNRLGIVITAPAVVNAMARIVAEE